MAKTTQRITLDVTYENAKDTASPENWYWQNAVRAMTVDSIRYVSHEDAPRTRMPSDPVDGPYEAQYWATFKVPTGFANQQQVADVLQVLLYDWGGMGGQFRVLLREEDEPGLTKDQVNNEWVIWFLRDTAADYHVSEYPETGHNGSDLAGIRQLRAELEDAGLLQQFGKVTRRVFRGEQELIHV